MPTTTQPTADRIRAEVAARYSSIGGDPTREQTIPVGHRWAEHLGYPIDLLDTAPAPAVASFTGIGAPVLQADLVPGEQVLDLGCGSGLDTFLMSRQVLPEGHVYGVDLAPGMLGVARRVVAEAALQNVTILEGAAEQIPLSESSVDVAVVNGLFNLTPDKQAVAQELARVIRVGGRLVGAEIVITDDRPPQLFDREAWFR